MIRPVVSFFKLVVCVVVCLYSLVITIRLMSLEKPREDSCPIQLQDERPQVQQMTAGTVPPWEQDLDFEGFNNETGTPDGHYIVPNYVHFVKFGQTDFSFVDTVCVLAAFQHQKPEKLFFHTDVEGFHGKYWDVMMNTTGFKEVVVIRKMELPIEVFGQKLNKGWKYLHGGDVARILVLREFGGIYLDSDSYVVRSLNDLRRFEMSIPWRYGDIRMDNQVVVAHKDARFLRLWFDNYKDYKHDCFFCNAGGVPARKILKYHPYLVHRVERLLGHRGVMRLIYTTKFPEWRDFYTFHILSRHLNALKDVSPRLKYPVVFDEFNVLDYPVAFRDLCKAVYPFSNS